ncbi:hypothetical protein KUH03_32240 [Sphingobacterium sp. E70]|uniref:hypothetical protein n=1 Tax=Sphingobacterium sp. E70 TaxID=2853439 RepID=UPI00211D0668|nr:hypothetical protein [Sphingobacterium sp. E70]ULT23771.1 hypothetical protein KUH03_32240 [Sphingobacterium sp. E70]
MLVRRIRMDLALTWQSYGFGNVQEFHVVDIATGSLTKLDVPLVKSQPTAPNILADGGKVYFPVNTKKTMPAIFTFIVMMVRLAR